MSGANYEYCSVCNKKAFYVGEEEIPENVVILHSACRDASIQEARIDEVKRVLHNGYDRIVVLKPLKEHPNANPPGDK